MPNEQEWTRVQKELVRQTEAGELFWDSKYFPPSIRKNVTGDVIYSAAINGRMVIVYEYTYAVYDESGSTLHDESGSTYEKDVSIEFVDNKGNLQWQWPQLPYRRQLLDAIQYRLSGAYDFLKSFLPRGLPPPPQGVPSS